MKIKFKIIFFLILLFSLFVWVKNSQAVDINFTKNFGSSWAFIDKPNNYDYEPSAMVDNDGTWKVWTCGGEITIVHSVHGGNTAIAIKGPVAAKRRRT